MRAFARRNATAPNPASASVQVAGSGTGLGLPSGPPPLPVSPEIAYRSMEFCGMVNVRDSRPVDWKRPTSRAMPQTQQFRAGRNRRPGIELVKSAVIGYRVEPGKTVNQNLVSARTCLHERRVVVGHLLGGLKCQREPEDGVAGQDPGCGAHRSETNTRVASILRRPRCSRAPELHALDSERFR